MRVVVRVLLALAFLLAILVTTALRFTDSTGKAYTQRFICNADQYRQQLVHDDEMLRTLYDLQQIPKHLEAISKNIRNSS